MGKYTRRDATALNRETLDKKEDIVAPHEIYASKQLTSSEKWCLMAIYSLSHEGICYATNQQIGEKISLTSGGIGQRVVGLAQKGYIKKDVYCTERDGQTGGNKLRQITIL